MTSEIGEIGWQFPPTNGGRVDGFNDPGIAHFSGSPMSSLARETIQNSMDARGTLEEPVHVSFELVDLPPDHIGRDELADAIDACKLEAQGDLVAESALDSARELIRKNTITCLRVSDSNTTGLQGKQWRALVKMQGVSLKPGGDGAGGSHGIGKYAPSPFQICVRCSIGRAIRKTARTWNISRAGLCSCLIRIKTRRRRELGFMGLKKVAANS